MFVNLLDPQNAAVKRTRCSCICSDGTIESAPSGRSVQLAVRPRLAAKPSFRAGVPTFSRSLSMKKGGGSGGVSFFLLGQYLILGCNATCQTQKKIYKYDITVSTSNGETLIVDSTWHYVVQTATRIPYVEIEDPLSESWKLGPVCVCGCVRMGIFFVRKRAYIYLTVSDCLSM